MLLNLNKLFMESLGIVEKCRTLKIASSSFNRWKRDPEGGRRGVISTFQSSSLKRLIDEDGPKPKRRTKFKKTTNSDN